MDLSLHGRQEADLKVHETSEDVIVAALSRDKRGRELLRDLQAACDIHAYATAERDRAVRVVREYAHLCGLMQP